MRILLTGGTGLIGKEVGKALVAEGFDVVILTRDKMKARIQLPFLATIIDHESAVPACDVVIHLAGENLTAQRWSEGFKKKLVESRVNFTQELARKVMKVAPPKLWIQGSAIGIYGETKEGVTADESSKSGEGFLPKLCVEWEAACANSLPKSVRQVMMRTGVVMTHRGGAFAKMADPTLQGLGGTLGSGTQKMSVIHLEDLVSFVLHAIKNESMSGAYNLVCPEPISQQKCAELLCKTLNARMGPSVPKIAVRMLLGEIAEVLMESQSVVSKRLLASGFKFKYQNLKEILSEIGRWYTHPMDAQKSVFSFFSEQFVSKKRDEVFPFFADAKNLEAIMPPFLHFKIESMSSAQIELNTKIEYSLKVHGVPLHWFTDIAVWDPPHRFVDHQLKGPYSLWYHEHRFIEVSGGTLLQDWVRFELPLGKVGALAGHAKVQSDVSEIFAYREKVIAEKFN